MRELPVLFSGPMVRAILDGRKTQTRRILKPQPSEDVDRLIGPELYEPMAYDAFGGCYPGNEIYGVYDDFPGGNYGVKCPWRPGDKLWVRETWADNIPGCPNGITYKADHIDPKGDGPANPIKWKPSIFMPRAASRIMLEVTDVRVEHLQDISADDARAEGMPEPYVASKTGYETEMRGQFRDLWDSINAKKGYGWDANPWVWVIVFRRVERD